MKNILAVMFCVAMLSSCGGNSSKSESGTYSEVSIEVKGMTCEKMCGGAISKGLEKLEGVTTAEVKFDSENPIDLVTVEFNSALTSPDEMKEKIESLAGGMYSVESSKLN